MTARELPPAEWHRLTGTYLEPVMALLVPGEARVLVVEDDGRIVGTWGLFRPYHVDGVWIDPSYRHGSVVARRLLSTMKGWLADTGARAVLTYAVDDHVRDVLAHLGAQPLDGTPYLWPLKEHV